MKLTSQVVLLVLLFTITISIGILPDPYCLSKPLYKQFPLVQEQILSHDMDDSFSGYNLDIQLTSESSFATVSKKFKEIDRSNAYIPSIISHYLQHKDNGVGKESFILYKDLTGSVHFSYGFITSKNTLPQMNNSIFITNQRNIRCFDAALFLDHGIAIIDCLRMNVNNTDQPFTNLFYYVDLSDHASQPIIKKVQNDVYADFQVITKRKLLKFTQSQTVYPYLVRAYYAQGVQNQTDNTYIQLFGAADPMDLQSFGVVDRTYLHKEKLALNDVVAYNGHLYILDSFFGLFRLAVLKDHRILIYGSYQQQGMQKFDIYSNDLEDQIIIALANSHNVYEVNWGSMTRPIVLNKYSLMSDSTIKDIKINDEYVIVQSRASALNQTNKEIAVDYTWVFTKGSRTYMNAYQIINHNSSNVQIDFDASENHIYTADETGLSLFKIDEARLNLHYINETYVGKNQTVIITATSTDPNTNKVVKCEEKMIVFFTAKGDKKIYETGFEMNKLFSTNYPGSLQIPLDYRFMGPNITYSVDHLESKQIPLNYIDKVNRTFLSIDSSIRAQDITFFHTDMLQNPGRQLIIYYYQDTRNITHIAQCLHVWQDNTITCRVAKEYQHQSRIATFTTAYFTGEEGSNYYYVMVLEGQRNQVVVIDFTRHKIVARIQYEGHQEAQVYQVAASNGFLYVLRKNIKTIDVYSLNKCKQKGKCQIQFSINSDTLKPQKVDYFAPDHITTDFMHPQVLFIKCLGSVILLDVDNRKKIHVMDQIFSTATKDTNFRIAVNKYRMILSAYPDTIEQYSLERIYQKDSLTLMKTYPLYGYKIQPGADIEFSDNQFLVYINAYDPAVNVSVILIYRSGYPSSAVLYDTIYLDKLYSRPGFQIQVSGDYVDFLSIAAGDQFIVYRVFEYPYLTIKNTYDDYTLNIKGSNKAYEVQTDKISVKVVNFPNYFTASEQFNKSQSNLFYQNHGNYTLQDRKWFQGHVINYNFSCDQCNASKGQPKVKLRQHVDDIRRLQIGGNDFVETFQGAISLYDDLFFFNYNGSIKNLINLPDQKLLQTCLKLSAAEMGDFVVTACQQLGRGINLYMTSLRSFKPITSGPFMTNAYHVRTLQTVDDVVMIVDQNSYPDYRVNAGSVFLYRVSVNHQTNEQFDFLDQIDNDDLLAAHGWTNQDAIISNAHLTYSSLSNTYRLYLSELDNGFFVIDFTRHSYESQIHLLSINYVDMNELLKQHDLHMPSDATFQAITFSGIISLPNKQLQKIVITTKNYHNFQVTIIYDQSSKVTATVLNKVLYRYSFYQSYNEVKSISGYLAMGYTLPSLYIPHTNYTRQYIAVYDMMDYQGQADKGYAERYILGAFPLNHREPAVFAFNRTYDHRTNGTRIGLIVSEPQRHYLSEASLSRTLQIQLQKNFKDQKMNITAYNDFKSFTFEIRLVDNDLQDDLVLIIILSVAGGLTIFFVFYLCVVYHRKKKASAVPQSRQSLITESQSFIDDNIPRSIGTYQPPQQQGSNEVLNEENENGYNSDNERQSDQQEQEQQQQESSSEQQDQGQTKQKDEQRIQANEQKTGGNEEKIEELKAQILAQEKNEIKQKIVSKPVDIVQQHVHIANGVQPRKQQQPGHIAEVVQPKKEQQPVHIAEVVEPKKEQQLVHIAEVVQPAREQAGEQPQVKVE